MAGKFMDHAKMAGWTMAEVGVVGGSMLLTTKFLDFNMLFANKIKADPTFAKKWYIVHHGAFKLVGGALAATYIKNPWLKLLCIGIAATGLIEEVRVLTSDENGLSFFNKIGQSQPRTGAMLTDLDRKILEAARQEAENMSGAGTNYTGVGLQDPGTAVGMIRRLPGVPKGNRYVNVGMVA